MDFDRRTPDELFAIAADIESYPSFVPWCIATRIRERQPAHWLVDNLFGRGPIRIHFATRADFAPPERLDIESSDRPFEHFRLEWRFTPRQPAGTRAEVGFDMAFRSELARILARISLHEAERRIVAAFRGRAERLYGPD